MDELKRHKYIMERNLLIASEALLTALINTKATVVIGKPSSNCKVTRPIINIQSVVFDNGDVMNVEEYMNQKIIGLKADMLSKQYKPNTVTNKMKRMKSQVLLYCLIDICYILDLPLTIILHTTSSYRESIESIVINGKLYSP